MAAPVITLKEMGDQGLKDAETWAVGTVKADTSSDVKTVYVCNNWGSAEKGTDMIECTVTALDGDGLDKGVIPANHWINVQLNDEKEADNPEKGKFTPVGGDTKLAIRAMALGDVDENAEDYDPIKADVIKGDANDGELDTEATKNCYAKLGLRVDVPSDAAPGTQSFIIRIQGYYTT